MRAQSLSGGSREECIFLPFPASRGLQHSLVVAPFIFKASNDQWSLIDIAVSLCNVKEPCGYIWIHPDNPGYSPCFKVNWFATLIPLCHITYSQVLRIKTLTPWRDHYSAYHDPCREEWVARPGEKSREGIPERDKDWASPGKSGRSRSHEKDIQSEFPYSRNWLSMRRSTVFYDGL